MQNKRDFVLKMMEFKVDHRTQSTSWEAPEGAVPIADAAAAAAAASEAAPAAGGSESTGAVGGSILAVAARPAQIVVHLRALANTPRLKKMKFKVAATKDFGANGTSVVNLSSFNRIPWFLT